MSLSNVLKRVHSEWLHEGRQVIPVEQVREQRAEETCVPQVAENLAVNTELLMQEAQEECTRMLAEAKASCAAMIQDAQTQATDIRRSAEQAGFEEGLRRGREEANVELAVWKSAEATKLTALVDAVEEQRREQLAALAPIVEELAMTAVRRLLYRELKMAPANVTGLIDELIAYVIEGTSVQIRVHPEEFTEVRQEHPRWNLLKHGDWEVSIVPDATLSMGDCEILADSGHVDAKLQTRLSEMQHALEEIMAHQGEAASGAES